MQVKIYTPQGAKDGTAIIEITDIESSKLANSNEIEFAIKQSKTWLTNAAMSEQEFYFQKPFSEKGNKLEIEVDSTIVNAIDRDLAHIFYIKLQNGVEYEDLEFGRLIKSNLFDTGNVAMASPQKQASQEHTQKVEEKPESQPEPETQNLDAEAQARPSEELSLDATNTTETDTTTTKEDGEANNEASNKKFIYLGLVALLLLCLAGAIYYFLNQAKTPSASLPPLQEETKKTEPNKEAQNKESLNKESLDKEAQNKLEAEKANLEKQAESQAQAPVASAPPISSLRLAKQLLASNPQATTSLAEAKKIYQENATEEDADAAFLLFEDAAEKGNAEAMYRLGQFYDPKNTLPKGSIQADQEQAEYWYKKANEAGFKKDSN